MATHSRISRPTTPLDEIATLTQELAILKGKYPHLLSCLSFRPFALSSYFIIHVVYPSSLVSFPPPLPPSLAFSDVSSLYIFLRDCPLFVPLQTRLLNSTLTYF